MVEEISEQSSSNTSVESTEERYISSNHMPPGVRRALNFHEWTTSGVVPRLIARSEISFGVSDPGEGYTLGVFEEEEEGEGGTALEIPGDNGNNRVNSHQASASASASSSSESDAPPGESRSRHFLSEYPYFYPLESGGTSQSGSEEERELIPVLSFQESGESSPSRSQEEEEIGAQSEYPPSDNGDIWEGPSFGPMGEGETISETGSVVTLYLTQQEEELLDPEANFAIPNTHHIADREDGEPLDDGDIGDQGPDFIGLNFMHKQGGYRASTAPARPLTDLEEFRRSNEFLLLENTAIFGSQLIQRGDNKFDLDSVEGQKTCRKFLTELEKLNLSFKVPCSSRKYRNKFSQAYKVLYKEDTLCYLTEILDSAQEGFPYLWVNSEKYVFSKEVLEAGEQLFEWFCKTKHIIRNIYNKMCEENVNTNVTQIIAELRQTLQQFDLHWVNFEQLYVLELMLIESDARRHIKKAIDVEKEISSFEMRERLKGKIVLKCPEYNSLRGEFAHIIGEINAVANTNGRGRDDLGVEVLQAAEGISRRITTSQSRAVSSLAQDIKTTFRALRDLVRKYSLNIEVVDPQLKNNPELVEALAKYETAWEKGKQYFTKPKLCNQLIHFSEIVEAVSEKYKSMQEQIECMDTEIFVSIPCLLVLNALDNADKQICSSFYPPLIQKSHQEYIRFINLQRQFELLKSKSKDKFQVYNLIESLLLDITGMEGKGVDMDMVLTVVHGIKRISMGMQRYNPTDWNDFLNAAIGLRQSHILHFEFISHRVIRGFIWFCC